MDCPHRLISKLQLESSADSIPLSRNCAPCALDKVGISGEGIVCNKICTSLRTTRRPMVVSATIALTDHTREGSGASG